MAERPKLNLGKLRRGLEAANEASRRARESTDVSSEEQEQVALEENISNLRHELAKKHGNDAEEIQRQISGAEKKLAATHEETQWTNIEIGSQEKPAPAQAEPALSEQPSKRATARQELQVAIARAHEGRQDRLQSLKDNYKSMTGPDSMDNIPAAKVEVAGSAKERLADSFEAIRALQQSVCSLANSHIMQIDTLEKVPLVTFDDAGKKVIPIDIGEIPVKEIDGLLDQTIKALTAYLDIKVAEVVEMQDQLADLRAHRDNIKRALNNK